MYEYEEYDPFQEPEPKELENGILSLVKAEVDKQVESFKEDYEKYKGKYFESERQLHDLKSKYCTLEKQFAQAKEFEVFKGLINEENFETILSYFNLKTTGIKIDGMHSENIPLWFKMLIKYYDDKNRLIYLMDIFSIKYEKWIHTYKMPYEYNEEEVNVFFKDLHNRYITNGCNFNGNMGFFWSSIRGVSGDSIKNMKANRSFSNYIPWQLFLKNPLLVTDEFFSKIIESLRDGKSNSGYFFRIQEYQELTIEQRHSMFKYIPKNMYEEHKSFVKNNKDIIKTKPELAIEFTSEISSNQFSTFYYLNFPLEMQMEFVKSHSRYETVFELIKKMEISKEEKVKLLSEVVAELL